MEELVSGSLKAVTCCASEATLQPFWIKSEIVAMQIFFMFSKEKVIARNGNIIK